MQLCLRIVTQERFRSWRGEDRVVLAPHRQHGRPLVAEILMPLRAELWSDAGVIEEVELDAIVARSIETRLIEGPGIRADMRGIAIALLVLKLCRLRRQQFADLGLSFRITFLPVRVQIFRPERSQALIVGVAVLCDYRLDALGMLRRQPE